MSGREYTAGRRLGTGAVLGRAGSIVTSDLRIPGMHLVAGLLTVVPVVGPLIGVALTGLAVQFADETLGRSTAGRNVLLKFLSTLAASIVAAIAILIGLVLLILPGLYLALKFSLLVPAIWVGDEGPIAALSDSFDRTTGHLLTVIGVGLAIGIVAIGTMFVAVLTLVPTEQLAQPGMSGATLVASSPLLLVVSTGISVTLGSLWTAASVVMYREFV